MTLVSLMNFSELDLNRLDGDTVCPTMKNGQDDLPGKIEPCCALNADFWEQIALLLIKNILLLGIVYL